MREWTSERRRLLGLLAALLLAGGLGLAIGLTDEDGDGRPDTITIRVDGPDPDTRLDDPLPIRPPAQEALQDYREALQEDAPPAPAGELQGEPGQLNEGDEPEPIAGPLAAQELPGCRTRFVRNQSSRRGVRPRIIVWHYTVSADRPGWADNDALTAMANNPANGVSWHASIGRKDGNCAYNVPLSMKAWTQASANPFSVGLEVIATGREARYVEGAGKRRLFSVTRTIARRLRIPIRRGEVTNCRPTRSGIVEHADLGACGGGHRDVNPFAFERSLRELRASLCGPRCRARRRHRAVHEELRRRNCAPPGRTRSDRCRALHRENSALHARAKREGWSL